MRRKYGPFSSERFVADANMMVVHDLDNEKGECEIDFIAHEHVRTFSRDRLKTAEDRNYAHCAHCISPESYIKHSWYR